MAKQVLLNSLSRNLGCEVSTAKYLLEKVEESLREHLLRGHSYTMRGICTLTQAINSRKKLGHHSR